jgi:hypothetical protein
MFLLIMRNLITVILRLIQSFQVSERRGGNILKVDDRFFPEGDGDGDL